MRMRDLAVLVAGVIAFGFIVDRARAQAPYPSGRHGDGHAENHDWYMRHKQPGSATPCCSTMKEKADGTIEGDCRPVRAFRADDGGWHAIVEGRAIRIPRHAILKESAPDGRAHLCMSKVGTITCFFEPQPKG